MVVVALAADGTARAAATTSKRRLKRPSRCMQRNRTLDGPESQADARTRTGDRQVARIRATQSLPAASSALSAPPALALREDL